MPTQSVRKITRENPQDFNIVESQEYQELKSRIKSGE